MRAGRTRPSSRCPFPAGHAPRRLRARGRARLPRRAVLLHRAARGYALPEPTRGAEFLLAKASIADIASIPVIVTSGFALPSGLPGASAVLPKPFDIDSLLELIRRFAPPRDATSAA